MTTELLDKVGGVYYHQDDYRCVYNSCASKKDINFYLIEDMGPWALLCCIKCLKKHFNKFISPIHKLSEQDIFYLKLIGKL